MKKRLSLKTERLADLSEAELRQAAGGAYDETYTGRVDCVLSIRVRCVTSFCTFLDCINTAGS